MDDERYARGLERLGEIDGDAGRKVLESLADIAPDLARYVIEFPFGDVYSRPGLGLREREIATVAALAAMERNAGRTMAACRELAVSKAPLRRLLRRARALGGK